MWQHVRPAGKSVKVIFTWLEDLDFDFAPGPRIRIIDGLLRAFEFSFSHLGLHTPRSTANSCTTSIGFAEIHWIIPLVLGMSNLKSDGYLDFG
jgi:hypothetical protein